MRKYLSLLSMFATLSFLGAPLASADSTPRPLGAPSADVECGKSGLDERQAEALRVEQRKRFLEQVEPTHTRTIRESLDARMKALAAAEGRARERWVHAETTRRTLECVAQTRPEPFCAAIASRAPDQCRGRFQGGGPANRTACRFFAALGAARADGNDGPCGTLDEPALAQLCRVAVSPSPNCDEVQGGDDEPPRVLCLLLTTPDACQGDDAAGEPCALAAFARAVLGDPESCQRVSGAYQRLASACLAAAAGAPERCTPDENDSASPATCGIASPWPAAVAVEGTSLSIDAAVANVFAAPARCAVVATTPAGPDSAARELWRMDIDPLLPGQARHIRERVRPTTPVADLTAAQVSVNCEWQIRAKTARLGLVPFRGYGK